MDYRTLDKLVEEALENLYDRTYLAGSALREYLADEAGPVSADRLHRVLLEVIERLRPAQGSPSSSAPWRRYHYVSLRYLEGLSHKATASQLGLSVRQAHRVRSEAISALASALWKADVEETRGVDRAVRTVEPGAASPRTPMTLEDELARLDAETRGPQTDVTREAAAVAEVMRPLIDQRGIAVSLQLEAVPRLVAIDRSVLRQVLVLLLMSGLAIPRSKRIRVAAGSSAGSVVVDVQVTCDPVPDGELEVGQDSHLATARRLIDVEGGALEVQRLDDETCFRLVLPPPKTETVLTIDDNPDLARLFDLYLQGTRYQVIRAKTAQSAIRAAEKHRPAVVTLDVMMPFHDGWEIFRQLRDNPQTREIPIVVCSILPERELALALGAADFLAKPVTRQSLLDTLDRCLYSESRAS